MSSEIWILGLRGCERFDMAKGFGAPFGVLENMLDSGCPMLVSKRRVPLASFSCRTTRMLLGSAFLVVRGVFPRSFPGVLKSSATFLWSRSVMRQSGSAQGRNTHLVFREDLSHVLVEPVHLVARRKGELLNLGLRDRQGRISLFCDPGGRANLETRASSHRHCRRLVSLVSSRS